MIYSGSSFQFSEFRIQIRVKSSGSMRIRIQPVLFKYCSGYESINARVYVCDNLCTVLGKNAPNGYTEIHQSILNSYSTLYLEIIKKP